MDKALALPALVLLDEAGAGTDPERGRRARDGDHRSLPPPRRDGGRDDALRRAEVVRVDDRGRDVGGLRVRSRDVRADLPAELRIARQQPRARDRDAARAAGRASSSRRGAQRSERESAARRAPRARSSATCRRSSTSAGSSRASGRCCEETRREAAGARAGAARPRRDVPQAARPADRRAAARGAARDRRGRRRAEGPRVERLPRTPSGARRAWCRRATSARRARTRGRRSRRSRSGCASRRMLRRQPAPAVTGRPAAVGDRVRGRAVRTRGDRPVAARRRTPKWTCAASGCARGSTSCACSCPRPASPRHRRGCASTSSCSRATGRLGAERDRHARRTKR